MSRNRNKKKQHNNHNQQQTQNQHQDKIVAREFVSVDDWNKCRKVLDILPHLEEAVAELKNGWESHVAYLQEELQTWDEDFEEVNDCVTRLMDLISECSRKVIYVDGRPRKKKNGRVTHTYVAPPPQKPKGNLIAVVIVTDISDGKL